MHGKGGPASLSRCEREAGKTEQHTVGTGHRSNFVATVELHHLVACTLSRVVYLYRYLDRLSSTRRLYDEVTVGERGVAQAMSKGEQRTRRRVNIIAEEQRPVPSCTMSNMVGHLTNRAR